MSTAQIIIAVNCNLIEPGAEIALFDPAYILQCLADRILYNILRIFRRCAQADQISADLGHFGSQQLFLKLSPH
ncbi:hypothetical protein D3C80_1872930 [compost metagenome]